MSVRGFSSAVLFGEASGWNELHLIRVRSTNLVPGFCFVVGPNCISADLRAKWWLEWHFMPINECSTCLQVLVCLFEDVVSCSFHSFSYKWSISAVSCHSSAWLSPAPVVLAEEHLQTATTLEVWETSSPLRLFIRPPPLQQGVNTVSLRVPLARSNSLWHWWLKQARWSFIKHATAAAVNVFWWSIKLENEMWF